MDLLSNFSKNDEHKPSSDDPNNPDHRLRPTKSDLVHSAKVVADAAKAHLNREPDKYDKAEVAGATADLMNAAAEYGKLDDKEGIGKYVDKAEDYLRRYKTSHHPVDHPGQAGGDHTPAKPEEHGGGDGGGAGGLMKMAGDFLKK